jgi:hypothetical protein
VSIDAGPLCTVHAAGASVSKLLHYLHHLQAPKHLMCLIRLEWAGRLHFKDRLQDAAGRSNLWFGGIQLLTLFGCSTLELSGVLCQQTESLHVAGARFSAPPKGSCRYPSPSGRPRVSTCWWSCKTTVCPAPSISTQSEHSTASSTSPSSFPALR